MIGLDTNVIVRFLTVDQPDQAATARRWIEKECTPTRPGFINRIVLCEIVWVLDRAYGYDRSQIAVVLDRLMRTEELRVEDSSAARSALRHYESGRCDFAVAYLCRTNLEAGCDKTLTFDRGAAALDGFELL
ncbi:MAG: PIN domain-containing protein [Inquilinaceae bacterium]